MHSSRRRRSDDADRPTDDDALDTVDSILDRGVVIDGFRRLSVLGLELATVDGPTRVRRAEPQSDGRRQTRGRKPEQRTRR
jgi:hypothetical protein